MLPDWPELKTICAKAQMRALHEQIKKAQPVLGMIHRKVQHEGKRFTYETEEGEVCELECEHVTAKMELSASEVPTSSMGKAVERVEGAAEEIAAQMGKVFFERVDEATQAAGTAVDAGGKGFTFDLYCDLMGRIELDFDAEGQPIMPTLCASPTALQKIKAVLMEALRDEENRQRIESIINKQRERWRAREADRKLVD